MAGLRTSGLIVALVALSLVVCSAGRQDSLENRLQALHDDFAARDLLTKNTLIVAKLRMGLSDGGPKTFNPAYVQDAESKLITSLLSPDLLAAAAVITWKPVENGGSSLTVTLRSGLTWSDGSPLQASDWVDAIHEIYLDPRANARYRKTLLAQGELAWLTIDSLTIRIDSRRTISREAFMALCRIPPQPMAKVREWRKLGQKGSLGTGLRSVADYQYYGFIDQAANAIMSCGDWQVSAYRPGFSLDLQLRTKKPDGLQSLHFDFFDNPSSMEQAFQQGQIDLMPLMGRAPHALNQTSAVSPNRIVAYTVSSQTLCLLVNPKLVATLPWLLPLLDQKTDRNGLSRSLFDGFALPVHEIWQGIYPLFSATTNTGMAPSGSYDLELRYDRSRPDRLNLAAALAVSDSHSGLSIGTHALGSSVDEMVAFMAYGGVWQTMLMTIDEQQDPVALLPLLAVKAKTGTQSGETYAVLPLFQAVALLWASEDLKVLDPELENLFLAYAMALH